MTEFTSNKVLESEFLVKYKISGRVHTDTIYNRPGG